MAKLTKPSMAHQILEKLIRENPEADENEIRDRFRKIAAQWKDAERAAFLEEVIGKVLDELADEGRIERLPRKH